MPSVLDILTGNTASGLLGGALNYAALENVAGDFSNLGSRARDQLFNAGAQAKSNLQFRPFTITGATGATAGAADAGNLSLSLSPQEQAIQNLGLSGAAGLLGQQTPSFQPQVDAFQNLFNRTASQIPTDITAASQSIYDQLRSMQSPEEERARLSLEQRLVNQGRSGVRTSMFGGTPEQLALEKAILENRGEAALQARGQALSEQQQMFQNLGGFAGQLQGLFGAQQQLQGGQQQIARGLAELGYLPQQQAMGLFQPALAVSDINQVLQSRGVGTEASLQQSGIEGLLQGNQLKAQILAQGLEALLTPLTSANDEGSTGLQRLLGGLSELLGGE